jgi:hypothetical protein
MSVDEARQQRDIAEILDLEAREFLADGVPASDGADAFPGNNNRAVCDGWAADWQDDAAA